MRILPSPLVSRWLFCRTSLFFQLFFADFAKNSVIDITTDEAKNPLHGIPKILFHLFLTLLGCLAITVSIAQSLYKPDRYRAINWTMEHGLSWNTMNVMIKDVDGFLWIGTGYGGLTRFDGINFNKVIPNPHKTGALASDVISVFVEDSLHNLWIGTDKGLSRYDIKGDTFTNFTINLDSKSYNAKVIPFWSTREKVYCLEYGSGFVAYDIRTLEKKNLLSAKGENELSTNGVALNHIQLDEVSNELWMLEQDPSQRGRAQLLQISLKDGQRHRYDWPCYRQNENHNHSAEAIQYDTKRNSLWINSDDGLFEFTIRHKQFHQISALSEFVKLPDYGRYVGLDLDPHGRVWLATRPKGILVYDPAIEKVQQVFSDVETQQLVGLDNLHVYCDPEGIVWTSDYMDKGIFELLPYSPTVTRYSKDDAVENSLSNNLTFRIVPGPNGELWIGTADGLNIFDPVKEKFEVFREKDLPGIKGNVIVPVHVDTTLNKAWLCATSSVENIFQINIYEMDMSTRKCSPIIFREGSRQLDPQAISPAQIKSYGNKLVMADEGHGLFEIKKGELFADLVEPFNSSVSRLVVVNDRQIYVSSGGYGGNFSLKKSNGKWVRTASKMDTLQWSSMVYNEKDQTFWVSLKYELVHYDSAFKELERFREKDGYAGAALVLLIDNSGNLWFINILNQIGRLNTKNGIITVLTEADGYQKQKFSWFDHGIRDSRGDLYFGATGISAKSGGLDRIHPERYLSDRTSDVYIKTLAINRNPFANLTGVSNVTELKLEHDENTISLETGIIDYYAMGKGRLRYRLEGDNISSDWQYAPGNYTIRYEGLPPGTYRLVMQASNVKNEFNSIEKVIFINISSPFWETWWFRVLILFAVAGLIYSIIQLRSRNLKQQNKALEAKVMTRTAELKQTIEELKGTQAQLIQSEKMASLGELTAGIAHEIQNPLNFVNNFSEVSYELLDEMKEEIGKGNASDATSIAEDVKSNLQKILHHGKRADAIVKGMLMHSRNNSGTKELTDINALADEYLRLAYHGLRAKDNSFNAAMKTSFDPSIGSISVVPQDIGRVILNLITNAFYAVSEVARNKPIGYEPTVWVTTKKISDKIEVAIKDNGNGIPPKVIDKIFQPFFTTKPTGQGTGLGLSLSYDIVKAHSGELKVETKYGEGSKFIIILPTSLS